MKSTEITSKLALIMNEAGLTKADMARKMSVSRAFITQMLAQGSNPSWKKISEFLALCGYEAELVPRKKPHKTILPVPEKFAFLFWDFNLGKVDAYNHKAVVFERILNSGKIDAWRWLIDRFSKKQIINFIDKHHSKLNSRSFNFWAVIFNREGVWHKKNQRTPYKSWRNLKNLPS